MEEKGRNGKKYVAAAVCCLVAAGVIVLAVGRYRNAYRTLIRSSLHEVTSEPRGAGLPGEQRQIKKLAIRLHGYGYDVGLDEFNARTKMNEPFTTQNVIARRQADSGSEDADILIVSAHIDSIAATVGAVDNASGVAALEAVAKKTRKIPSDTEVWYVVFSGEEEGMKGSAHFLSSLTDEERERIAGDIQLDMLGHRLSDGYQVNTTDGRENAITGYLLEGVKKITGKEIAVTQEKSSDHVSFAIEGIPSALFAQDGDGYENHKIIDDMDQIDLEKLADGARIAEYAVQKIMSDETGSLRSAKAPEPVGYLSPYTEAFDVDTSLQGMKNNLGTDMKKTEEHEDEMLGTVSTYECRVRWVNMEEPLLSRMTFYNGDFQQAELDAEAAGYDWKTMKEKLSDVMGEPKKTRGENHTDEYDWEWQVGRIFFQMNVGSGGSFQLIAMPYSFGLQELYDVKLGSDGEPTGTMDEKTQAVWDDIISRVIRKEERAAYMDRFVFYTDGLHYQLGFTQPAEPDNHKNSMWLDFNDIFDENMEYRHFYSTLETVIHEYGHVFAMNEDQLDIAANGDDSISLPPYKEDSYMAAFMKEFYPDTDVDAVRAGESHSFREHPDEFVSQYAVDKTMEDFAESFCCFVLMDKQEETSVARRKINFFYDYPEMTEVREWIRGNFDCIK